MIQALGRGRKPRVGSWESVESETEILLLQIFLVATFHAFQKIKAEILEIRLVNLHFQ